MVISYWLTRRQLPVDSQLLWQMREFCENAIRMKSSSTMVDKAADLLLLIDNRVCLFYDFLLRPRNTRSCN